MNNATEIHNNVYNYPTKHSEGFTKDEIDTLLKDYPGVNKDRFDNALCGIPCMVIDKEIIIYHCDVETALFCGLEDREMKSWEMD